MTAKELKSVLVCVFLGFILMPFGFKQFLTGYRARNRIQMSCADFFAGRTKQLSLKLDNCEIVIEEATFTEVWKNNKREAISQAYLPLYAAGQTQGRIAAFVVTREPAILAKISKLYEFQLEREQAISQAGRYGGSPVPQTFRPTVVPTRIEGLVDESGEDYLTIIDSKWRERFQARLMPNIPLIRDGDAAPSMLSGLGMMVAGLLLWLCAIPYAFGVSLFPASDGQIDATNRTAQQRISALLDE